MAVIAGCHGLKGLASPRLVRTMLKSQAGPAETAEIIDSPEGLYGALRLHGSDQQCGVFYEAGTSMAADIRLDNRDEIQGLLGCPRPYGSDARLLFEAYRRFGLKIVDWIVGDFAFAVFAESSGELILVRDPTGQRPLHYRQFDQGVAFASLPSGLRVIGHKSPADRRALAEFAADVPRRGRHSFFADIQRVLPGEMLNIRSRSISPRRYFHLPSKRIKFASDRDYEHGLRERIDAAVRARLSDAGPRIGTHLSGGLDSASVTSTAAREARANQEIFAYTAAPRLGFEGSVPLGRVPDESPWAALVAQSYDNIVHRVVRGRTHSVSSILDSDSCFYEEPMGHLCNQLWWDEILSEARDDGVRVLLTGEAGNLAFSAGTVNVLPEFIRRGLLWNFAREAALLKRSGVNWRGTVAATLGPLMPHWLWRFSQRSSQEAKPAEAVFLSDRFSAELSDRMAEKRGGQPAADDREARWNSFIPADPGCFRKKVFLRWGIEERDATSDRRLLDFCFAVPVQQLVRFGITRSLVRRAMSDRLPHGLLFGPRGYQSADWHELLGGATAPESLAALAASDVIDSRKLTAVAEEWPLGGFENPGIIARNRLGFLRALSAASFELACDSEC